MSKTIKKVAKVIVNIPTHASWDGSKLPAGSYDYNITEFLPKGAFIVGVKTLETTTLVGGTSMTVKVGASTGQVLVAAVAIADQTGARTPAIATDPDGVKITTGGNLGFTSVGDYTAGVQEVYVEYIY